MTPDQALAEAKQGAPRPIYLMVGEEHYLQAGALKALRAAVVREGVAGLNEDRWIAGDVEIDQVLSAARTLPMMAKRRVVVVQSIERWESSREGQGAAALDRLTEYAQAPATSTVLLLTAIKLDKRRRLYTLAQKEGWLVACDMLPPPELPRWIERAARERGNPLAQDVAELIAELSGPDLAQVVDALERVCLFAGSGRTVTEDMVSDCIVRVRPTVVWELVGAVGRRDAGAALAALDAVYDPQDRGLRLLGVLAWSARQLLHFESATRRGLAPPEAAKQAGAPPFKARELAAQIRQISRAELELWLESLAEVDLALKGGSKRPAKAVLEHAILKLCRSGAGSSNKRQAPARLA
jgi:DNA polymerase-3 subunit delta